MLTLVRNRPEAKRPVPSVIKCNRSCSSGKRQCWLLEGVGRFYIYIYTWLFLVRVSEDVQGPLILGVALQSALDTNCHQKADHP